MLKLLLDEHVPGSIPGNVPKNKPMTLKLNGQRLKRVKYITALKVKEAFASFGAGKAAGDHFKPLVLQNLSESTIEDFVKIYRASVSMGIIPLSWKKSRVTFIPKPGKDPSDPKSYRPITLNSFLLKALEIGRAHV